MLIIMIKISSLAASHRSRVDGPSVYLTHAEKKESESQKTSYYIFKKIDQQYFKYRTKIYIGNKKVR